MTFPRFRALALGLSLSLAFSNAHAAATGAVSVPVETVKPWVRWMPANLPAAGYVTLVNPSKEDVVLAGVSSPDYAAVMLHESYTAADGSAGMRMVDRLTIPAGGRVALAPGGYHLMLMDARHRIEPGDTVVIELAFADGRHVSVRFPVKPANTRS